VSIFHSSFDNRPVDRVGGKVLGSQGQEKRKEKKRKIHKKGKFKSPLWERSEVLEDRPTVSQTEGS
jgi:hypothetical protein